MHANGITLWLCLEFFFYGSCFKLGNFFVKGWWWGNEREKKREGYEMKKTNRQGSVDLLHISVESGEEKFVPQDVASFAASPDMEFFFVNFRQKRKQNVKSFLFANWLLSFFWLSISWFFFLLLPPLILCWEISLYFSI